MQNLLFKFLVIIFTIFTLIIAYLKINFWQLVDSNLIHYRFDPWFELLVVFSITFLVTVLASIKIRKYLLIAFLQIIILSSIYFIPLLSYEEIEKRYVEKGIHNSDEIGININKFLVNHEFKELENYLNEQEQLANSNVDQQSRYYYIIELFNFRYINNLTEHVDQWLKESNSHWAKTFKAFDLKNKAWLARSQRYIHEISEDNLISMHEFMEQSNHYALDVLKEKPDSYLILYLLITNNAVIGNNEKARKYYKQGLTYFPYNFNLRMIYVHHVLDPSWGAHTKSYINLV